MTPRDLGKQECPACACVRIGDNSDTTDDVASLPGLHYFEWTHRARVQAFDMAGRALFFDLYYSQPRSDGRFNARAKVWGMDSGDAWANVLRFWPDAELTHGRGWRHD